MSILPSFALSSKKSTAGSDQDTVWEYGVDFETGQLTGAKVNGAEAVKVWIWKCLMTERFLFPVYSWRYGSELRRYVGKYKTDEYLKTDLRLAIEDALLINKKISAITNFKATLVKDRLNISFTAKTVYGVVRIAAMSDELAKRVTLRIQDDAPEAEYV